LSGFLFLFFLDDVEVINAIPFIMMIGSRILYDDRSDAATQLLNYTGHFKTKNGIVVAIPRGGLPVGKIIADDLNWPMFPLLIKKIGHPKNPEFAIGYISAEECWVEPKYFKLYFDYINAETARLRTLIATQTSHYRRILSQSDVPGKLIVVTDDGMATGNTILAAIRLIRKSNPEKIVVAVPVASIEAINKIESVCDELICPAVPDDFICVGQFYRSFPQVSDEAAWKLANEQWI
jgi:predicted phosphoribosyltransferase